MYFFILHLSIADILTAFFTLLPEMIWTITFPQFYGGNVMCKAVKYGQALAPYLSSYTLVMTAVDRYQVRDSGQLAYDYNG
jgi:arginine vasopressin receptor 1A